MRKLDAAAARLALQRAATAADQAERSLANRDFHRELYAGCGDPLLTGVLDDLRDQTALVSAAAWRHDPAANRGSVAAPRSAGRVTPGWEREAQEHIAVPGAAEAGGARRAVGLLRAHIESFVRRNLPDSNEH